MGRSGWRPRVLQAVRRKIAETCVNYKMAVSVNYDKRHRAPSDDFAGRQCVWITSIEWSCSFGTFGHKGFLYKGIRSHGALYNLDPARYGTTTLDKGNVYMSDR